VLTPLTLLRRKKLVLDVLRCEACRLVFRWPMDTPEESYEYYQDVFSRDAPQVILPGAGELQGILAKGFDGTPLDLTDRIRVLKAIRQAGRVLDYGCSWGYGTHQLLQPGYQTMGFEISRPRALYARKYLGLDVLDDFEAVRLLPAQSFDVIFSNHVLEHLTHLREALDEMARLLCAGGLLFHVLPNFAAR